MPSASPLAIVKPEMVTSTPVPEMSKIRKLGVPGAVDRSTVSAAWARPVDVQVLAIASSPPVNVISWTEGAKNDRIAALRRGDGGPERAGPGIGAVGDGERAEDGPVLEHFQPAVGEAGLWGGARTAGSGAGAALRTPSSVSPPRKWASGSGGRPHRPAPPSRDSGRRGPRRATDPYSSPRRPVMTRASGDEEDVPPSESPSITGSRYTTRRSRRLRRRRS